MNKTIAERFLLNFRGICPKSGQPYQLNNLDFRDVARWLKEQPENQKMFTLEEVEAIAWRCAVQTNKGLYFDEWSSTIFEEIKQELVK